MTNTLTVRGMKVRSRSNRRYVVVFVRTEPYTDREGFTYQPKIEIERRSDNIETLRKHVSRSGRGGHTFHRVIVDTTTGEEVPR